MDFDEEIFLRALMERPSDAKRFSQSFDPAWLKTVELQPILSTIFAFVEKYTVPPNIQALRNELILQDKSAYDVRYKEIVDRLEQKEYDISEVIQCLDLAKSVAISWSLENLYNSPELVHQRKALNGKEVLHSLQQWIIQFAGANEQKEFRIGEAIDELIKNRGWNTPDVKIPCGISIIDEWTNGGLRPKNLGILMAPTGSGKTTCLTIMAYKMSLIENKKVLFITNELSMDETTEKFGALISGEHLDTVMTIPAVIRDRFSKLHKYEFHDNLYLAEVTSEISTDDIEAMIHRYDNLYGWKPDVVIIDYMERMKPTVTVRRDQSWNWYGYIAKDLARFSKRYNVLVWTAGQTNRGGFNNEVESSLAHAQGSVQHLQEAAAVISVRQRGDLKQHLKDPENEKVLEFTNLKVRHSKRADTSVYYPANLGRMHISKEQIDPKSFEDTEETGDLPKSTGRKRGQRKKKTEEEDGAL